MARLVVWHSTPGVILRPAPPPAEWPTSVMAGSATVRLLAPVPMPTMLPVLYPRTGHGEYFIRYTVAHDISALMEYKGLSIVEAAQVVVMDKLVKAGGEGGVIGVDHLGNITMTFNTSGMFRAFATADGKEGVFIFKDEKQ